MSELNRRTFLKLLGQGTAALGMGFSLSAGTACAKEDSGKTAETVNINTPGKYQIFQPGEYLDWEKGIIEERFAEAKRGPRKGAELSLPGGGVEVIKEEDILNFNRKWDPYNPLFNDRDYARKAGYPGIPAWPTFKGPRGSGVSQIPKDMADLHYFSNDGTDMHVWTYIFAGDSFTSETESIEFEDITVPGSDLRMFKLGSSAKMYNAKGEQVGWSYANTREAYRQIIDGSPKPSFSEHMTAWVKDFPPAHYTTDEEWDYVRELWKKESIRGSSKLYWEDVNVGDEPTWICSGPISYMDIVGWYGGGQNGILMRDERNNPNEMFRDRYGQYFSLGAAHYGGRNIPGARAIYYNDTAAKHMTRAITNYIGDAGLVTRIRWIFYKIFKEMRIERPGGEYLDKVPYMKGKEVNRHGSEGDTVIGKSYVSDKYINDRGEYTIDLTCWGETLDGDIVTVVAASAKLPSRKG